MHSLNKLNMKKKQLAPYPMNSISELHRILELPGPGHPLISIINFDEIKNYSEEYLISVAYDFYCISLKRGFTGKMKYGQNHYDYDKGLMTFIAPGQVLTTELVTDKLSGWWLLVHPDFLRNYQLSKTIKKYGYFSYAVNEALHLSEKEEAVILSIVNIIQHELLLPIDKFSQDVMISQIELLLNYCNRYYDRQFITRKHVNNDLLIKIEQGLFKYINGDEIMVKGVPTVKYLADQVNVSPHYLSDMLRQLTGQGAQQYIHSYLIEKAKEMLTTTRMSVGEVAYSLGFQVPQSFNKLFKNKTNLSPLAYRASFN
jgi:AraC family transcriptional regulator, transcriptional activator of pobA